MRLPCDFHETSSVQGTMANFNVVHALTYTLRTVVVQYIKTTFCTAVLYVHIKKKKDYENIKI